MKLRCVRKSVVRSAIIAAMMLVSPLHAEAERTKFLLLDGRIIERVENAKLAVGTYKKHSQNPLFAEEKSWEPRFDNLYANVLYDEEDQVYKCWYSPFIIDESTTNTAKQDRVTFGFRERRPDITP